MFSEMRCAKRKSLKGGGGLRFFHSISVKMIMAPLGGVILFFLAFVIVLPSFALAEKGDDHGQFSGSYMIKIDGVPKANVGYYLESPRQLAVIERWGLSEDNLQAVLRATEIYDAFIMVVHRDSVIDGQINPKFTGFLTNEQVKTINNNINDFAIYREGCMLVPIVAGNAEKGRANVVQFFIYDEDADGQIRVDDIESCLSAGFGLAK